MSLNLNQCHRSFSRMMWHTTANLSARFQSPGLPRNCRAAKRWQRCRTIQRWHRHRWLLGCSGVGRGESIPSKTNHSINTISIPSLCMVKRVVLNHVESFFWVILGEIVVNYEWCHAHRLTRNGHNGLDIYISHPPWEIHHWIGLFNSHIRLQFMTVCTTLNNISIQTFDCTFAPGNCISWVKI